jgi:amino acid efflux transporter
MMQATFGWSANGLLLVQIATLVIIWLLGMRSAGSSANVQTLIAILVVALVAAIWWRGDISLTHIPWPTFTEISPPAPLRSSR